MLVVNNIIAFLNAIIILLFCIYMPGCAWKPETTSSIPSASGFESEEILDALNTQATRLSSFKAGTKLRLTIQGRTQPGIRGQLMWTETTKGKLVRMTGLGPFDVTVFDCLIARHTIFFFIPSHDMVYVTSIGDMLKNGKDTASLIKEVSWLLNPWSVIKAQDVAVTPCCGKGHFKDCDLPICISFSNMEESGSAVFDRRTLSPVSIEIHGLEVFYRDPVFLVDGTPYPSKICLKLDALDLEMKITLKDIQLDKIIPEAQIFDPAPFFSQPMQPLRLLFESLRYSLIASSQQIMAGIY